MNLPYLKFQLKPSVGLGTVFLLAHVGAVFCVYFTPLRGLGGLFGKAALIFCGLVSLMVVMRGYILLNNPVAIVEIGVETDGDEVVWHLKRRSGELVTATVDYPIFMANYLVIINFVLTRQRAKVTVPISMDALVGDDFRKLKMVLKTAR